jgi:hypothetical protein
MPTHHPHGFSLAGKTTFMFIDRRHRKMGRGLKKSSGRARGSHFHPSKKVLRVIFFNETSSVMAEATYLAGRLDLVEI